MHIVHLDSRDCILTSWHKNDINLLFLFFFNFMLACTSISLPKLLQKIWPLNICLGILANNRYPKIMFPIFTFLKVSISYIQKY